jgi:hypothetical protein
VDINELNAYLRHQSRPALDYANVQGDGAIVTFRSCKDSLDGAVILTIIGRCYTAETRPTGNARFTDVADTLRAAAAFVTHFEIYENTVTKQSLLEDGAFILEQEGWMLARWARETSSSRIRQFSERYEAWVSRVRAFREANPGVWKEPPDNS